MSEENFSDLFQSKEVKRTTLQPGDKVQAAIAAIDQETVFLDVGVKSEGIISAHELLDEEGTLQLHVGDMLDVYFLASKSGELRFTTRLGSGHASTRELEDAFNSGIPVEGKVTEEVKGGFAVTVAGTRCFCPYSQMDIRRIENAENYTGQTFAFRIIEFSGNGRNIILSARVLIEEQRAQEREVLQQSLTEGMQVSGTVTSIRDFGAFVDLGGIDGLIPISELAWGQTDSVSDVLQTGQQVEVIVKRLDWEQNRISLSLRETLPDPWDQVVEKYPVGSIHTGTVARLAQFGAFISLEPGVDGLLHISKLGSGRTIHHSRELLETGQEVTVTIEAIDPEKQRISLVPDDYRREANNEADRYTSPPREEKPQSMGTLGDLLKKQMDRKGTSA